MTFLKLFLICTFKDPNLAEKLTNLAENLKKVELHGVHGVCFFQVWPRPLFALSLTLLPVEQIIVRFHTF